MSAGFSVAEGFATFGPELVDLRARLDRLFVAWAHDCGAEAWQFPPLLRVADLDGMDYFDSFPHLGLAAAPIAADRLAGLARDEAITMIPPSDLAAGEHMLPSAACYACYFHFRGSRLDRTRRVTTIATCFRNEREYVGLRRLRSFTMREIVCIGAAGEVTAHLAAFREKLHGFCATLGLGAAIEAATDPFFRKDDPRAAMQKMFPVKEEFVYGGSVAFASLNYHRNFFGERCGLSLADGSPAFTGCVAFGLERWLYALLDRFGSAGEAAGALRDAA